MSVLYPGDVAELTCSASIGYPQLTTLSIVKNNVTLFVGTQSPFTYSTQQEQQVPHGVYECVLDATGVIFKETLKITEKGN